MEDLIYYANACDNRSLTEYVWGMTRSAQYVLAKAIVASLSKGSVNVPALCVLLTHHHYSRQQVMKVCRQARKTRSEDRRLRYFLYFLNSTFRS